MAEAVSSQSYNPYQSGRWSLPAEILAALPTDAFLQLELAHKICCHAYTQQVSRLESEAQQMQSTLAQNQHIIKSLERRVAAMETEMQEHQQTARQSSTQQHKLVAEKNALIETVKRLNREVAKLEHFKRNLLQQLQDDAENDSSNLAPSLAAVDLTTERLVTEVLHSADAIAASGAMAQQQQQHEQPQAVLGFTTGGLQQQDGLQQQQQRGLSPGRNSAGSLKQMGIAASGSANSSPYSNTFNSVPKKSSPHAAAAGNSIGPAPGAGVVGAGTAGQQPNLNSILGTGAKFASPPPAARAAAGRGVVGSAGGAGSVAGFAAAGGSFTSDGGGARTSPRVDGKEFFRQARARLSYEQFSQFLVAIKELNAGRASRENTLSTARGLFGTHNDDLYGLFESLIMRHLTST